MSFLYALSYAVALYNFLISNVIDFGNRFNCFARHRLAGGLCRFHGFSRFFGNGLSAFDDGIGDLRGH